MANLEHLDKLREGVARWNEWKRKRIFRPGNLNDADLSNLDLRKVNFRGTSLHGADLSNASLCEADLSGANLREADLREADLRNTGLCATNLSGANLSGANLSGADLRGINLRGANLSSANLKDAQLSFRVAREDLDTPRIHRDLFGTDILRSDITGACIHSWQIDSSTSFNEIICAFVYLGIDSKTGEFINRIPQNSKFFSAREFKEFLQAELESEKVGDFEQFIRSIEFPPEYYESGISILSYFNHVLRVKYPDIKVKVRIEQEDLLVRMLIETPDGEIEKIEQLLLEYGQVVAGEMSPEQFFSDPYESLALKFELQNAQLRLEQKSELLRVVSSDSKERIDFLQGQVNYLMQFLGLHLQTSSNQSVDVVELAKSITSNPINITAMSNNQSQNPTHNFETVGIVNTGDVTVGGNQIGNQHNYAPEQKGTLADAAKEIQDLLQQLAQAYPTETPAEKAIFATKALESIEQDPNLKTRVVGALKASGMAALQEAVDNPLFNVVSAFLEGFLEP